MTYQYSLLIIVAKTLIIVSSIHPSMLLLKSAVLRKWRIKETKLHCSVKCVQIVFSEVLGARIKLTIDYHTFRLNFSIVLKCFLPCRKEEGE